MAHNIATINGQSAFAYLDAPPWHGLGLRLRPQGIDKAQLIDHALDTAQLRWTVGSEPIYLADGTQVRDHRAAVRYNADKTIAAQLGVVGVNHTHIQNSQAVDILRPLAEDFGYVPAAAGALGNGERCWMLLRMADASVDVLPGDSVNGYSLLHWHHNGQGGVHLLGTSVRVVCQNTLHLATSGQRSWITVRHTSSAAQRLDQAAKLVRTLATAMQQTGETFRSMAQKRLSADQLAAFIAAATPNTSASTTVAPVVEARRDTIAKLVFYGRGAVAANAAADTAKGEATVWAALNGVTEYYDHVRTGEAKSAEGLRKAQESAVFGGNSDLKLAAFTLARQLVAA